MVGRERENLNFDLFIYFSMVNTKVNCTSKDNSTFLSIHRAEEPFYIYVGRYLDIHTHVNNFNVMKKDIIIIKLIIIILFFNVVYYFKVVVLFSIIFYINS